MSAQCVRCMSVQPSANTSTVLIEYPCEDIALTLHCTQPVSDKYTLPTGEVLLMIPQGLCHS